jgi:oligoendopeptidase F
MLCPTDFFPLYRGPVSAGLAVNSDEEKMTHPTYQQQSWSLADLYSALESPEIEQGIQQANALTEQLEAVRPRLTAAISPEAFMPVLQTYEQWARLLSRLQSFGFLSFAADTQDQRVQSYLAQVRQRAADLENRTLFLKLWWQELDDTTAGRLLEASGDYRYWLETLRREQPYTLSEGEEKIINLKNVNGSQALLTLYRSITNRYTFQLEVDGERRELTRGELQVYYRHADPDLRAAAYQELYRVYGQDAPILGQIYQYRVRDWRSERVELRGFSSPIAARNLANDIPDEVVDTLLDVCQANSNLFHRYFLVKARWLGLDRLRRYDLYAPVAVSDKRYPFDEAVRLVLDSLREFNPNVAELARRVFDEGHIDSEIRKGKSSGAFCATVSPDLTPWVLQSYQGYADDVTTLAHELGHAVHAMLAAHHNTLTQRASLPLAETASTFAEMLLIDRVLADKPGPAVERDLLFRQMDDAYATIMRQAYFALFERQAHQRVHQGALIDELSQLYLEQLQTQFGDSLVVSEDFQYEWLAIPHIFSTPFYVYAYSFGQLLVLSLYQQYRHEGEAFKPRYLEILAAGGSDSPALILQRAGVDIWSADFWQGGFDVVADLLAKLEALPADDGR